MAEAVGACPGEDVSPGAETGRRERERRGVGESGRRAEGAGESSAAVESARHTRAHTRPAIPLPQRARVRTGGRRPGPLQPHDKPDPLSTPLQQVAAASQWSLLGWNPRQTRGLEGGLADQTRHTGQQTLASNSCAHSSGRLHFSEAGRGGGWRMSIQHHGQWPQGPWPLGPGAGDKAPAYRLGLVPRSTRLSLPTPETAALDGSCHHGSALGNAETRLL